MKAIVSLMMFFARLLRVIFSLVAIALIIYGISSVFLAEHKAMESLQGNMDVFKGVICVILGGTYLIYSIARRRVDKKH